MAKNKRFTKAQTLVEAEKLYSLEQATEMLAQFPKAKFDETVEVAVRLGVDPRKAEENVRGTVALPHGTGKTVRIVVFCKGEKEQEAKNAGADFVGVEELVKKIEGGWMDFDAAVATPDVMGMVGKVAKILGPRGLMPNPKTGTVTFDITKAIEAIKAGRVEYRVEKAGIVQVGVGKVSFGSAKIKENISSLMEAVVKARPKSTKGFYVESLYVSTTMGPSIKLDPTPYRSVSA